jgi:hypothetical protein
MLRGLPNRELVDESLQEEIAVLADLMLAVAHATGPLSQDEIDDALGLSPARNDSALDRQAG